jgi:hypothetical protein
MRDLESGAKSIAAGDLERVIPVRSEDEFGQLAAAFNAMTAALRNSRAELREWGRVLEEKVEERLRHEDGGSESRCIDYDQRFRGIGTACAMACGRIAGVISPFAVGLIIGAQNVALMWWLMGACGMIAPLMSLWLAIETRGVNLEKLSLAAQGWQQPDGPGLVRRPNPLPSFVWR